jgi:hypothetical protein
MGWINLGGSKPSQAEKLSMSGAPSLSLLALSFAATLSFTRRGAFRKVLMIFDVSIRQISTA